MNAGIWLGLAVIAAALWSGLLLTLTTILHPIYASRDGRGFRHELGLFLPVARRSPTNYILVLALLGTPIAALVALRDEPQGAPFVLTAIGLAFVVVGPLSVSRWLAEPNYDVILSWDPEHPPGDWEAVRRKYFTLNWIRGVLTWSALATFASATWIQLT